jgi:hydrophobe/amphiphile efflux-1 (HAE1) family protein
MSQGNISALAIRHPIPPIVLFIILTLAGLVSFFNLPITNNPDIDFPVVTVSVSQPGAAPSELETQVTKKIEDAVASVQGIDHIQSTVIEGSSTTMVEFKIGYNTDRATNDVRNAVAGIRSELPQDIYEPQVRREDASGDEILYYAVASNSRSVEELSWLIDNTIARTLSHVPGVGTIERIGGVDREIRINLDPNRLIALGVTAADVNSQLRAMNIDLPGGRGNVGNSEQSIRTLGSARSVEALSNSEISIPGGRKVRLNEIATIVDGASELRQVSRLNGEPAVGFNVRRAPNSSEVTAYHGILKALEQMKAQNPDITFQPIISQVLFTIESFDASVEAIVIGAILAVLVVWVFLRDGRATMISALAMPLSTIPTFLVMQWLGFTLNGISMLALALVVGILVDDAIVEIENIVRHIRMGKRPYAAALEAADEIGLAVVATTMTIVVVFVPVSFMPGIAGQYFKSFGITVAVAVLFSLLVARLITPLMAAYFLTPSQKEHPQPGWISNYLKLLSYTLSNRWKVMAAGTLIFLGSIGLVFLMPSGFIPPQDVGFSILSVEMPPGTTLENTDITVQRLGSILAKRPEVEQIWTRAGRRNQIRNGQVIILLKPRGERIKQKKFEEAVMPDLLTVPGARIGFNSTQGWGNKDISLLLTSDNGDKLSATADKVLDEMRTLPFLVNIGSTAPLQRPEIQITPRLDRAAEQGVSVAEISHVAKIGTLGEIDTNVAKFNLGDRQIPIRVQIDPSYRNNLDTVANLRVRNSNGQTIPLKALADISMGSGPVAIERFDRARRISLQADLRGMELGDATKAINALPTMAHLPAGVTKPAYGQSEQMNILFMGFAIALATGILLIVGVLILLFRNFFQPATILMALPLSVGGAMAALLIGGMSLSLPALIGLLMLMGIVTKNSILLVEYAIVAMREHGLSMRDALMDAGAKRAQPIVMTTIAMIAGMVPIAAGWGADADFRQPMAVAVIGGLVTSTLLSLVFVPVFFSFVEDIQHWIVPKLSGFLTPRDHEPGLKPHIVGGDD